MFVIANYNFFHFFVVGPLKEGLVFFSDYRFLLFFILKSFSGQWLL